MSSNADVFVPQRGIRSNEVAHEIDAELILHHLDGHSAGAKQFLFAQKCVVLADHDARNSIKQDRAGTHRTWRQCRVNGAVSIYARAQPAGIFQGVHLAVQDDTAFLHTAIVAASDNFSVVDQDRADRNASFVSAQHGFFVRGPQKFICHAVDYRVSGGKYHGLRVEVLC